MAKFEEAEKRLFIGMWICMKCGAKNRTGTGKKPAKCRKCGAKSFRLKKKGKKIA